jgi:hypothetical protein
MNSLEDINLLFEKQKILRSGLYIRESKRFIADLNFLYEPALILSNLLPHKKKEFFQDDFFPFYKEQIESLISKYGFEFDHSTLLLNLKEGENVSKLESTITKELGDNEEEKIQQSIQNLLSQALSDNGNEIFDRIYFYGGENSTEKGVITTENKHYIKSGIPKKTKVYFTTDAKRKYLVNVMRETFNDINQLREQFYSDLDEIYTTKLNWSSEGVSLQMIAEEPIGMKHYRGPNTHSSIIRLADLMRKILELNEKGSVEFENNYIVPHFQGTDNIDRLVYPIENQGIHIIKFIDSLYDQENKIDYNSIKQKSGQVYKTFEKYLFPTHN